jgi:PhnB protein
MEIVPYLNFNGDCREAFEAYRLILGGDLEMLTQQDIPMEGMPDDWGDKILHAHLKVGEFGIMGSDTPSDWYSKPTGMSVSLHLRSIPETERIFNALADGGSIEMPLGEQPWAVRFGITTDRYGIPWIINCESHD